MKQNDLVAFKNPEPDEKDLIFKVIELRGDRVLVQSTSEAYLIKPTFVYLQSDLKVTK